jgi:hypothetical protein
LHVFLRFGSKRAKPCLFFIQGFLGYLAQSALPRFFISCSSSAQLKVV